MARPKKEKTEIIKCDTCIYNAGENCKHPSNIGIVIKYHKPEEYYAKTRKELAKNCKNFKDGI